MPFVKVMIHAVWGTKNHAPFLTKEIRTKLVQHIKENAKAKGIYIAEINGYLDHLHCIFGLNADLSISKTMQLIKGESAHWMNKDKITKNKFEWADEYFAVSISESMLNKVKVYIQNQEKHHKKKTFMQEVEEFNNKYKFKGHG